jgi:hypothetical protein
MPGAYEKLNVPTTASAHAAEINLLKILIAAFSFLIFQF